MGLLDFLHGNAPKESEAEAYMREKNKEYTRKAAEYKRKEAIANMTGGVFAQLQDDMYKNSRNNRSKSTKTLSSIGEVAKSVVKDIESSLAGQVNCIPKKESALNECNECNNTPSIYDGKESALFEVNNASVKPSVRTVTVSGKVLRGTFEIGDKIEVITSLENREATIVNIIRQGEKTEYANNSSGMVGLIVNGAADVMIRKGDKIIKKKKISFK